MGLTIIHVDDNMRDLELASLAFSEIDPTITYVPLDEAGLLSELNALSEDGGVKPPGLIIVDWSMPQMSALQVIELTKADERLRDTPIAILTAAAPRLDPEELGVPDRVPLLIKPGTYAELVVLLRDLVQRVAGNAGAIP